MRRPDNFVRFLNWLGGEQSTAMAVWSQALILLLTMLYIAGQLTQIRETNDALSHEAERPVSTLHINQYRIRRYSQMFATAPFLCGVCFTSLEYGNLIAEL